MGDKKPWLKESFLISILDCKGQSRKEDGAIWSIKSCYEEPAVDAARNFMSNVVRVRVQYVRGNESLHRSFIIKAPLKNQVVNEQIFFENEHQMYKDILPKVTGLAKIEIAPKIYNSLLKEFIVLEDLNEAGYVMCDSKNRLDLEHSKAALIALAKFHAATVILKQENPNCIDQNGVETVYTHDPKYADRFKPRILMRLYGLAKVLETTKEYKHLGNILLNAKEEFWDLVVGVFLPNSALNVLNHGDLWTNNILFKYGDEGRVSDVKFIDFQMRRYCSPAIDLLYLFWTSAEKGVRKEMYELVELYRHTLNDSLTQLGSTKKLTRNQLKEDISRCRPIILLICLYLPVILPDPEEPFDITRVEASEENMSSTDFDVNPILLPFKGQYYRTTLLEICKELETTKIFQVLAKNMK